MAMNTRKVAFEALVTTSQDKDIPLAEALVTIEQHCEVVSFSATRLTPDIVALAVTFWVANGNEAAAKAREVAQVLQHRWPTDSVTIDGRAPKTQED